MEEIKDIKKFARSNDVPIIRDESADWICEYIREHNCKNVLEIGTAIGYSSIRFAQVSPDVKVTTIEVDIDRHIKAVQNIHDCGLENQITAIQDDAVYTDKITGLFDLIFIDGPKAQYIKFFEKYQANLAPDGVFISDNLSFHGMVDDLSLTHNYSTIKLVKKIKKYVDYLKANPDFETTFYPFGDGISVSKRKVSSD